LQTRSAGELHAARLYKW